MTKSLTEQCLEVIKTAIEPLKSSKVGEILKTKGTEKTNPEVSAALRSLVKRKAIKNISTSSNGLYALFSENDQNQSINKSAPIRKNKEITIIFKESDIELWEYLQEEAKKQRREPEQQIMFMMEKYKSGVIDNRVKND